MFSEVFFRFSFSIVYQALLAKGKEGKEEKQNDFSLRIGLQRLELLALSSKLYRKFFCSYG